MKRRKCFSVSEWVECKAKKKIFISFLIRVGIITLIPIMYFVTFNSASYRGSHVNNEELHPSTRKLLAIPKTEKLLNETVDQKSESIQMNCTNPAINEFPSDGFTRDQRKDGIIMIHFCLLCYSFVLLSIVCEHYLVPAVTTICKSFDMNDDIAGVSFLAVATSSPELFMNCIGTFVTKGDLGVGSVVGSAVFNALAVPAFCGILSDRVTQLNWWPITRDCIIYAFSVIGLLLIINDKKVMWYEALALVIGYIIYLILMYFNESIKNHLIRCYDKFKCRSKSNGLYMKLDERSPLLSSSINTVIYPDLRGLNGERKLFEKTDNVLVPTYTDTSIQSSSCCCPVWDIFVFPITLILKMTIPDCKKFNRFHYFTLLMSIVWIALISYVVAFLITILGDTLNIPDSVVGLTLLAAGTSVPEAVSSVIVTKQGHGAMGISNSIGSNTFDILLCLGIPWVIKAYFFPAIVDNKWVVINSTGLSYSTISLLSSLLALYFTLAVNKFRLDWKVGLVCALLYTVFLILASLIELNFFFQVNLPVCPH